MDNKEFSLNTLRDFSKRLDDADKFIESFKKEVAERVEYGLISEGERKKITNILDKKFNNPKSREKNMKEFINNLILLDEFLGSDKEEAENTNDIQKYKEIKDFWVNLGIMTKEDLLAIVLNPEKVNETNFVELEDKKAANSKNQELYKSIEDKEKIVKRKLEFLKFLLIKLIQDSLKSKKVENIEILLALSLDKVILYPFFLTMMNNIENREKMFRYVFTRFDDNKYGLFETNIEEAFLEIIHNRDMKNLFYPYFDLETEEEYRKVAKIDANNLSSIILLPKFNMIENCKLEDMYRDNLGFDESRIKAAEIISNSVENMLRMYPTFLTFDINLLQELSSYYKQWDMQKLWFDETDFGAIEDNPKEAFRFKIFLDNMPYLV